MPLAAKPPTPAAAADDLVTRVAQRVRHERRLQHWSLDDLAARSGVSRAMISKIERGVTQASAVVLLRLADALGVSMSRLTSHADAPASTVSRAHEQTVWVDPASGYVRRRVSPVGAGSAVEIIAVELPPGAQVRFAPLRHSSIDEQVLLLEGRLRLIGGDDVQELGPGDCAVVWASRAHAFVNPGPHMARYLVVARQQPAEGEPGPAR